MSQAPAFNLWPVAPAILLLVTALAVLLLGFSLKREHRKALGGVSLVGVLGAAALLFYLRSGQVDPALQGMFVADGYALFLQGAVLAAAFLALLFSIEVVERTRLPQVEYYALLLLSAAGMLWMAGATDLISIFLALEILSIALYILVGLNRAEPRSAAAALKYLLLGALASAFLLYGMALVYGQTGVTSLAGIRERVASQGGEPSPLLLVGLGLMVVGLGFKVALVPFHMWTPDVYVGAPPSVTAFMSVGAKVAGFAALGRIALVALDGTHGVWQPLLAGLAALTMTVGNLAALRQANLKRLLAYSGIAQAGYILVGLAAAGERGMAGALFYLLAYAFTNAAAFGVVIAVARWYGVDLRGETLDAYAGLADRRPWLAVAMSLLLLSLAGLPPLAGFMAKLYVFAAAVHARMTWLAIVGVLNSAVAAYYYLRVIAIMAGRNARRAEEQPAPGAVCPAVKLGLAVACLVTLLLGIWPAPILAWARAAAAALLGG